MRTETDSTVVEKAVQPRQTLLKLPAESLQVRMPLAELGPVPLLRSGQRAQLRIQKIKDTIIVQASCDSLSRRITVQDSIIHTLRTIHDKKTTYVDRPYTPWYMKSLAALGGLMLLLVGIAIFLKVKL